MNVWPLHRYLTPPVVYVPLSQVPADVKLNVRSDLDPASLIAGVREALRIVDPHLPIGDIATICEVLLFGVSALDPAAFVIACGAMTAIGMLAVLIPAGRAARVDPAMTLREEG